MPPVPPRVGDELAVRGGVRGARERERIWLDSGSKGEVGFGCVEGVEGATINSLNQCARVHELPSTRPTQWRACQSSCGAPPPPPSHRASPFTFIYSVFCRRHRHHQGSF